MMISRCKFGMYFLVFFSKFCSVLLRLTRFSPKIWFVWILCSKYAIKKMTFFPKMQPNISEFSIVHAKLISRWLKIIYMFYFDVFFSSFFREILVKINQKNAQNQNMCTDKAKKSDIMNLDLCMELNFWIDWKIILCGKWIFKKKKSISERYVRW